LPSGSIVAEILLGGSIMMRFGFKIGMVPAMLAILSVAAPAQTMPDSPVPSPSDQMLSEMLKPTTRPVEAPAVAGPQFEALRPQGYVETPATNMLREGTGIVDRTGYLRKLPDSPYSQFVFDNDPSVPFLPPMFVLPSLRLMQIEDAVAVTTTDLRFTVSGTVTEYKGNNYILLETGPQDVGRQLTGDVPPPSSRPSSAQQLLDEMLAAESARRKPEASPSNPAAAEDRTSGPGAVSPSAPPLLVLREGSEVVDRVGRLTHSADGKTAEFAFDSDGSALRDPPLIILPNLKLTTMENAVSADNPDVRFRVTGMITEYRGRNGVLLEKVVVVPQSVQQF
jgi:hypothetical protein